MRRAEGERSPAAVSSIPLASRTDAMPVALADRGRIAGAVQDVRQTESRVLIEGAVQTRLLERHKVEGRGRRAGAAVVVVVVVGDRPGNDHRVARGGSAGDQN